VEANVCMFFYSVFPLEIRFAWKIPAASLCMASFVDFCDIAGHHCLNVLTIAEFLIGKQLVFNNLISDHSIAKLKTTVCFNKKSKRFFLPIASEI
jgi:hypothetical protein